MNFGKYPFEPYGYQGGYFGKNNRSLAAALGGLIGMVISGAVILIYRLTAGMFNLLCGCLSIAGKGLAAGWREGIRTKP